MRRCLMSPMYLNGLLNKHKGEFTLVQGLVTRQPVSLEHEQKMNQEHLIDPIQTYINIYNISEALSPMPHKLCQDEQFFQYLEKQKIMKDMPIVLFDRGVYLSSRLQFAMRYYGMKKIFILDGGYDNWVNHRKQSMDWVKIPECHLEFDKLIKVDYDQIVDLLHKKNDDTILIDARKPKDFEAGHIPTAVNIEWYNFLDPKSFVFKSDEELMKVFVNHGVDLNKDIITYCQTGKTATVVNVALEILGKQSRLYDGSYADYAIQQYKKL